MLAHEMRNLLNTAGLAFHAIKSGVVAPAGSTGVVLGRCLDGLRSLVDRSLADVRLDAGIGGLERLSVAELVEEVEVGALPQAEARGVTLSISGIDRTVMVDGDRQILTAALANLLHNAFKFTRTTSRVELRMRLTPARVFLEVEDECGGLPPGDPEALFAPYQQRGADRSGLGLGLAICRKAATAHGGTLTVRDVPGSGCVFTLELPRQAPPPLSLVRSGDETSAPADGAASALDARSR